jgi:hypothetical protein
MLAMLNAAHEKPSMAEAPVDQAPFASERSNRPTINRYTSVSRKRRKQKNDEHTITSPAKSYQSQ